MICHGRIKNGAAVLDTAVQLPEDTPVQVEVAAVAQPGEGEGTPGLSMAEVFKDIIGKADGLPSDSAENHDHYLYGTPKR